MPDLEPYDSWEFCTESVAFLGILGEGGRPIFGASLESPDTEPVVFVLFGIGPERYFGWYDEKQDAFQLRVSNAMRQPAQQQILCKRPDVLYERAHIVMAGSDLLQPPDITAQAQIAEVFNSAIANGWSVGAMMINSTAMFTGFSAMAKNLGAKS